VGVLTFSPHPSRLFRPEDPVLLIQPPALKTRQLQVCGVDLVINQPFTPEFAAIEAEAFLPFLRAALPQLATIYVGENWRFGRGRRGDIGLLIAEARGHGLAVLSAPRINHNGEPISSTRIRNHLVEGEIEEANTLLGSSYTSEGVVRPGKQLGRTLGFPTLNLPWEPELKPRFGVYLVQVRRTAEPSAVPVPGVANYGLRPTVEAGVAPRLEVHLLMEPGAAAFDAGDELTAEWLRFLRPERRFADVAALRSQIALDRAEAVRWWAAK
jgi:riboflavin kinase / FMN adenylyltransferase